MQILEVNIYFELDYLIRYQVQCGSAPLDAAHGGPYIGVVFRRGGGRDRLYVPKTTRNAKSRSVCYLFLVFLAQGRR